VPVTQNGPTVLPLQLALLLHELHRLPTQPCPGAQSPALPHSTQEPATQTGPTGLLVQLALPTQAPQLFATHPSPDGQSPAVMHWTQAPAAQCAPAVDPAQDASLAHAVQAWLTQPLVPQLDASTHCTHVPFAPSPEVSQTVGG
jgi:hypothetical protein